MHLSRGVNKPTSGLASAGNPPTSKGIHERLSSELSDSSTDSAMMSLKKPAMSTTAPNGHASGGAGGCINSTSSTTSNMSKGGPLQQAQQDALAVPEGLEVHRRPSAGLIKVKLASASPQWDNKAEVEVDCENPDEVVDKMLQSIVDKFPPTAVITVEKGGKPVHIPGQHPQQPQYPLHTSQSNSLAGSPTHSQWHGGSPRHGTADMSMHRGFAPPGPRSYYGGGPQNLPWGARPNSGPLVPGYPQQQPGQHPTHYGNAVYWQNPNLPPYLQHPMAKQTSPEEIPTSEPRGQKKHSTTSSTTSYHPMPPASQGHPMGSKIEVREVIKEVPKIEIEWVEKIVEVPQVSYVDKYEEVPEVHEVIKHVPKIETVDVPREVVKYVPKVVQKIVENIVEVPRGEKIPVMRPQPVDTPFVVPRFQDRNVPVVMSQCIIPEIEETDEVIEVEVSKYVPYLVPVDVYVPLPVTIPVHQKDDGEQTEHPCSNSDPALLQHLMIEMNPHLQQLEMFNFQQQEQFQALINQSIQQARENGVAPPQPITNPATFHQAPSPASASGTGMSQRRKSELSRSSSAGASRRHPSRSVSRRISGIGQGYSSSSQVPPTMMVAPPQLQGYPPMYGSAPPPMMFQPAQQMQQMPPTLQSADGFALAGMYGYANGSASGMLNTLPGAPPTMMMSQPPQVNVVGPDTTAAAQPDKLRKASRLSNGGDQSSRQQSGAVMA
eukprot:GHVS01036262.1.p1 GENE.GHVS01036262.1~~GHVS01036262.1.p1  ORF type:complete len:718 (+),score=96.16 GHVS01036262.1:156-2309(+)